MRDRAAKKPPKRRRKPAKRTEVEARKRAEARAASSGRSAGGLTARRNVEVDLGEHQTYDLEDSANGRPSRKSTRKGANRAKPDANLHRRQIRRARSARARSAARAG